MSKRVAFSSDDDFHFRWWKPMWARNPPQLQSWWWGLGNMISILLSNIYSNSIHHHYYQILFEGEAEKRSWRIFWKLFTERFWIISPKQMLMMVVNLMVVNMVVMTLVSESFSEWWDVVQDGRWRRPIEVDTGEIFWYMWNIYHRTQNKRNLSLSW